MGCTRVCRYSALAWASMVPAPGTWMVLRSLTKSPRSTMVWRLFLARRPAPPPRPHHLQAEAAVGRIEPLHRAHALAHQLGVERRELRLRFKQVLVKNIGMERGHVQAQRIGFGGAAVVDPGLGGSRGPGLSP